MRLWVWTLEHVSPRFKAHFSCLIAMWPWEGQLTPPLPKSIICLRGYCCLVAKLCLTLCSPRDCSSPCSSVRGISQARILECIAISFSRDLPNREIEWTSPALQADRFFTIDPPRREEEAVKIAPLTKLLLELNMIIYVKDLITCMWKPNKRQPYLSHTCDVYTTCWLLGNSNQIT